MIDPAWEKGLYGYLWGKATFLECIPHAINGMHDHLHVILSIPPRPAVAATIGQLKHPFRTWSWSGSDYPHRKFLHFPAWLSALLYLAGMGRISMNIDNLYLIEHVPLFPQLAQN